MYLSGEYLYVYRETATTSIHDHHCYNEYRASSDVLSLPVAQDLSTNHRHIIAHPFLLGYGRSQAYLFPLLSSPDKHDEPDSRRELI